MVTKSDYGEREVEAALAVLGEVARMLGEYRDQFVLVGGGVPPLLYPEAEETHVGSTDVDLLLDHRNITDDVYARIRDLFLRNGYYEKEGWSSSFFKTIDLWNGETQEVEVRVDLLAGRYGGTSDSHRTQRVQDVKPRKLKGGDLLFQAAEAEGGYTEYTLRDVTLPNGALDTVRFNICTIAMFVVLKGLALEERKEPKDAYDVYFCLKHHPGGTTEIADKLRPHLKHSVVQQALRTISEKFTSVNHDGPKSVVDFMELTDSAEIERIKRDAHEQVQALLRALD